MCMGIQCSQNMLNFTCQHTVHFPSKCCRITDIVSLRRGYCYIAIIKLDVRAYAGVSVD